MTNTQTTVRSIVEPDAGLFDAALEQFSTYRFDRYRLYPAKSPGGDSAFAASRLRDVFRDPERRVYAAGSGSGLTVIAARNSSWDAKHFGFAMATIEVFLSPEDPESIGSFDACLGTCLNDLRAQGVRFVSMRLHGDSLASIHGAQDHGFRYIESIVWPIISTQNLVGRSEDVRLMTEADIEAMSVVAGRDTYHRGHFHCDPRFDTLTVDLMYAKWLRTAFDNQQPVIVIESDSRPAGFFVTSIDRTLSEALGYTYGRLQSLAVDSTIRGRGLGATLFSGTLALLRDLGADYIDSGYATKNHISAKIHAKHGFASVHDEITLHCWLD